jgi:acetyltransferase-like isoleucine patch superfamily enzyme
MAQNLLLPDRRLVHDWFPEPVPDNVSFGERSWLYSSFAFRHYRSRRPQGVEVGHDTGLYNGTFFDLGPEGEAVIGDYCTLVGAILCCNSRVVIRDFAFIAHEVVVADRVAALPFPVERQTDKTESDSTAESIFIGENVWIGARAIILQGARIGEGSIVGAAAVVDFEVPPNSLVVGNPARIIARRGGN